MRQWNPGYNPLGQYPLINVTIRTTYSVKTLKKPHRQNPNPKT